MNFEVLKRSYIKRNIMIGIGVVLVLSAVVLTFTRAKYRVTESVPLVSGTINFSPYDFNVVAMYLNKNGESISTDKAPHVGYTLNTEQSVCKVNDEKDENVEIKFEESNLYFNKMNYNGTKCSVYFDLIPDSENPVINNINGNYTDTSITVTVDASDNIGIYYYYFQINGDDEIQLEENSYTFDNLNTGQTYTINIRVEDAAGNIAETSQEMTAGIKGGDIILASANAPTSSTTDWTGQITYYYTGSPNNWVQFGGFWWRIIRINGDGSIRMIYQGTSANVTGEGTQIGESAFNNSTDNKTYVGLVYDGSSQHGYGQSSTIMTTLNNWYNNNLASYEKDYIDTEMGFCSDRNLANGYNWSDSSLLYSAEDRIENGLWTLNCNKEDILSKDNGKLPSPVGLITVDEAVLGGITWNEYNEKSYLYSDTEYWTMTPSSNLNEFVITGGLLDCYNINRKLAIRPVINLKSTIALTGSGTTSDPFKVVGAS